MERKGSSLGYSELLKKPPTKIQPLTRITREVKNVDKSF